MSYHTIVVHVDLSPHAAARIGLACEVARLTGAHLIGVAATGLSRFVFGADQAGVDHPVVHSHADHPSLQTDRALAQFDSVARGAGLASAEQRLVADDAQGALIQMARYADLVVLSQTDPDVAATGMANDLPAWVVMNVARPVLVVPYVSLAVARPGRMDGHALIGWNGSIEAARALRDALPLLRRAARVTVAHLGPDGGKAFAGQAPDLLAWLDRHCVRPMLIDRPAGADDGDALLSLAMEQQADYLVMGAYGHSRFRELMLGGMTRSMLQSMTVPMVMSH